MSQANDNACIATMVASESAANATREIESAYRALLNGPINEKRAREALEQANRDLQDAIGKINAALAYLQR